MLLGVSKHRILGIGLGGTGNFLLGFHWSLGHLSDSLSIVFLHNFLVDGRESGRILCLLLVEL